MRPISEYLGGLLLMCYVVGTQIAKTFGGFKTFRETSTLSWHLRCVLDVKLIRVFQNSVYFAFP